MAELPRQYRRAPAVALAAVFSLLAIGAARGPIQNRGEIFEISQFREGSFDVGPGSERGLILTFRIKKSGDWYNVGQTIRVFDEKKREIRDAVEKSYIDGDTRFKSSAYIRNKGSGQSHSIDGWKGMKNYTIYYTIRGHFSYALAKVGNESETVYAILPSSAALKDFVQD
ncbi:MAG: hypothetical protein NTV79_08505 [Candidatus Aureabacteria bacterium]|nr:hypothetical protein [Candidatus Auribacterota bacterium]